MESKRSVPGLIQAHKRSRFDILDEVLFKSGVERTSGLSTPVVRLEDHRGEINACKFHPLGELVMSSGFDKQIHLCCVYGETALVMAMSGHTDSVMEAQFSTQGGNIYSCSVDKTVAVWDTCTGSRMSKLEGHESCVNSVQIARNKWHLVCSGSDDRTIKLWDIREKYPIQTLVSGFQVTSTCFNDSADYIISGGADNDIKIWDIRKNDIVGRLQGHVDTISGISLSPCGNYLLSNSIDNTLRIWDIRPFVGHDRCLDVFTANQFVMEVHFLRCTWSRDGKRIAAGSSNNNVNIWDVADHRLVYELPGHQSSVIDVDFHPLEPIVVSGSSYEDLYMHELQS